MHTCMHKYMYIHIQRYTYIHAYMHIFIHTYMHDYIIQAGPHYSMDQGPGPAPGIGDIGSRLGRQILGGANFREKKYFFPQ